MSTRRRVYSLTGIIAVWTAAGVLPAAAYRPFDGTDAAVADLGKFEVETQPFGALQAGPVRSFIAPQSVFNLGFAQDWEAVLQGQLESEFSPTNHESLTGNGAFLKHVLRRGVLQDQAGPSIAVEFGLTLPNINAGATATKPYVNWVLSDKFPWGTIHLNLAVNLLSDPQTDFYAGVILEGPANWTVRPVAEFYSDSLVDGPQTFSALLGAIWQVNDDLAFDIAVRRAIAGRQDENELRVGMTIAVPAGLPGLGDPEKIMPGRPIR